MLNRRSFLHIAGTAAAATVALPRRRARAAAAAGWRAFEVTTTVEIQAPDGVTRVWVPLPLAADTDYQRSLGNEWSAPGGRAALATDARYGVTMVAAEFPAGVKPGLVVKSKVATRDRAVDVQRGRGGVRLAAADRKLYTAPTHLIPIDGIVAATARTAAGQVRGEVAQARALYEWIVENTFRDAKVRGCGVGDIKAMLESQNLGGKCADINALFVGMARALGIPARDVYGVRVADSRRGFKALGKSGDVTKAQHCRAEFFAEGIGWIPVDPGDVRKVVLEEPPGNLPADDPRVKDARGFLFGAWEMNWIGYNTGHDVELPGSTGKRLGYLMYPQAETAAGRIDCLDPATFKYTIASAEVA